MAPNSFQVGPVEIQLADDVNWPLESSVVFTSNASDFKAWSVVRDKTPLEVSQSKLLFDSGGSWSAYKGESEGQYDFCQFNDVSGERVLQAKMHIDEKRRQVRVNWKGDIGWTFPFDELFFLNAFSLENTLLLHSMSLLNKEQAYLFCGVSGAGKSTLGKIFEDSGYQVLCDERNAVSVSTEGCKMSSTPFYGTSEQAYKGEGPLKALVILDPSHKGCDMQRIQFEEALPAIYPMAFFPQYDRDKIEAGLGILEEVLAKTPVYRLNYNKESSDITEFLEDNLFSQT